MSSLQRRFEVLLPQRFNDGEVVPEKLFATTILELRERFGAVSSETQIIRGVWHHAGQSYPIRYGFLSTWMVRRKTKSFFTTGKSN